MAVLRIFERRKISHSRAREWERVRRGEEARGDMAANAWVEAGMGMTRTTSAPSSNPQQAESVWIAGRRYLAHLPYMLPKDIAEDDRLNFQHYYFRRLFKGLCLAPLPEQVHAILDVGCGTGRWAYEMALAFPRARVVGLDIELPRPGALPMPPNLSFVAANVLQPLPYADHCFDFVHQRMMGPAIPTVYWPALAAELVRVTRPGGRVELIEATDTYLNAGPVLTRFIAWNRALYASRGIDLGRLAYLAELLRGAGLPQVVTRTIQAPPGSWGGRLGHLLARNTLATFASMRGLYEQVLAVSPAQFEAALAALPDEWDLYRTVSLVSACFSGVIWDQGSANEPGENYERPLC